MRNLTLTLLFTFAALCACDTRSADNGVRSVAKPSTPVPTPVIPKDGDYNAKGTVTKINSELGSVELDHEDIPGVMPPMTMEFFVSDKNLLDGLKVGDRVDFVLRYKHPSETIVKIERAK